MNKKIALIPLIIIAVILLSGCSKKKDTTIQIQLEQETQKKLEEQEKQIGELQQYKEEQQQKEEEDKQAELLKQEAQKEQAGQAAIKAKTIQQCESRKIECKAKVNRKQMGIDDCERIIKMMENDMDELDLQQDVIDSKKKLIKTKEGEIEKLEEEIDKIENSSECKGYENPCK